MTGKLFEFEPDACELALLFPFECALAAMAGDEAEAFIMDGKVMTPLLLALLLGRLRCSGKRNVALSMAAYAIELSVDLRTKTRLFCWSKLHTFTLTHSLFGSLFSLVPTTQNISNTLPCDRHPSNKRVWVKCLNSFILSSYDCEAVWNSHNSDFTLLMVSESCVCVSEAMASNCLRISMSSKRIQFMDKCWCGSNCGSAPIVA